MRLEPGALPIQCYRLTHLYVDFNTEASCKYSSLRAVILPNIKIGSTLLNRALRFPPQKHRF